MKPCLVEGCDAAARSRGWCVKHYTAWVRYKDPLGHVYTPRGEHSVPAPYAARRVDGEMRSEHVLVAERALGRPLPPEVVVHHVDEDPQNNAPGNLVICPDQAYHMLLHRRMRAFAACGHYDWRKCRYCKTYEAPEGLYIGTGGGAWHRACHAGYQRTRIAKQAAAPNHI